MQLRSPRWARSTRLELLLLITAVLTIGGYFIMRYGGYWAETDTHIFTRAMRAILRENSLEPTESLYPNGYGYQALSIIVMRMTGLSVANWQLFGTVFVTAWIVFPAWLLYRELTGTRQGALLATVLLFVQAEFLFPVLRGTHEKFTRGLMLLCIFLLIRSLRNRHSLRQFTAWALAFYAAAYALITFNNLLAISFIFAVCFALVLNWLMLHLRHRSARAMIGPTIQRLMYATLITIGFSFLFTFHIYSPAESHLHLFETIWQKVAALLLDLEATAVTPYSTINSGWINLPAYLTISAGNWLLLLLSGFIWLGISYRWLLRRARPESARALLLYSFYTAFAFMGALSVLVDFSGAIAGNLQLRSFPSFAMLAAPLIAQWLLRLVEKRPQILRMAWALLALLALLATLKATNEPLLSNKWVFSRPDELTAVRWANEALPQRGIWTGYDERLETAVSIRQDLTTLDVRVHQGDVGPGIRDFLISDITAARALRLGEPLPITADSAISYDNGRVQIYHLRPLTPYQR